MKNSERSNARTPARTKARDAAMEAIAKNILGIETLAERKRDALDFHEVSVWASGTPSSPPTSSASPPPRRREPEP